MRILVVSQYFWPESFRVNELVSELTRRGHEVTVLTGKPNYPEGRLDPAFAAQPDAFSVYEGAEVLRVPLRPRGKGSLRLVLNYWSFVFWACLLGPWKLRGRPFDLVFCFQTSPITAALPAVLLGWLKRAPLMLWVLDLWPDTLEAVGVLKSPRALHGVGQLVRFIYKRCGLILSQSQAFFPAVEKWSGTPQKNRYFPQWAEATFDETSEASAALTAPEEMRPHLGHFNIMFAGNLGEAQDLPTVLAAAALLKPHTHIRWLLVGDGRAAESIRQAIDAQGLQSQVHLLGRHPIERMPAFFATADALLVSLKKEAIFSMTIPGKVQAYLAAGRPILALLDGEGARVVAESGAGLVAPSGHAAALAEQALALSQKPATERALMGEQGRAYCREHFDRTKLMETLEAWMEALGPAQRQTNHPNARIR
jgi:colanic acid biosynthesis glycosyl transferase WcaI